MQGSKELIDQIQREIGRSGFDFDIYRVSADVLSAESKNKEVNFVNKSRDEGLALRLFRKGRLGFAYTNDLGKMAIRKVVERAVASTQHVSEDPFNTLPSLQEAPTTCLLDWDESLATIPVERKLEQARILEASALHRHEKIAKIRNPRYSEEACHVLLFNSQGVLREHRRTLCKVSLMVVAEDKGVQEASWNIGFSPFFEKLDAKGVAEEASWRALEMLGAQPLSTRRCPAVFDDTTAGSLLSVLAHSFLGDNVLKGRSILKDKIGELFYSKPVTLLDNGLLSGGYYSSSFDGEGLPHRETTVVQDGVLKNFLYDCKTAGRAKKESTGHAVRGNFKEPPHVGVTNFYLKPGSLAESELLKEMGQGLWIRDLIGLHTANPVSGDFSLGAAGFWVEKGVPRFPVKGIALSGNLHELFRRLDAVASNLHFYGPIGSPSFRVTDIDVGGQ